MKKIPFSIAMFCAASLFAQDNYKNYYWIGQYEGTMPPLRAGAKTSPDTTIPSPLRPMKTPFLMLTKIISQPKGRSNPTRHL